MREPNRAAARGPELPLPLKILHLDDNVDDQELIRRKLQMGGIDAEVTWVRSAEAFEAALHHGSFDVILSDYTLPGYGGSAALAFAQARCPEIPYIFVSGTIGEERAIESIKLGATDYVLKDRLDRLPAAIRRALFEVTERRRRKEAETALRESEERFREMAENIREVFWIRTADQQTLLYISPAYEAIWGRSAEALGAAMQDWLAAVCPDDHARLEAAMERLRFGTPSHVEYRITRPDGVCRWIEERAYPVRGSTGTVDRLVGAAVDITERKDLEAQLQHAQKMEAIGQLAGGLAHDFNNVLTVVIGYARLLLDRHELSPELSGPISHIFTAGTRAANLTRQLLVFSRRQPADRQPVDVNALVDDMTAMLSPLISENIELRLETELLAAAVNADASMLEQVLMNLAVNARDAMPEGGTLVIRTRRIQIDETAARRHPDARPGDFVRLSVCDNGIGIPPEAIGKIFEPFYTTKEPGHGTGLGLATAYGIIKQHEGWIEVESTVGKGTCFHLLLPVSARPVPVPDPADARTFEAPAGAETILLVEDDAAVRDFAAAVLRSSGFRVLQASSGPAALETWRWHGSRIALLFTDIVIPQYPSGIVLAEQLRAEKPSLKVVLTSGYAGRHPDSELQRPSKMRFLPKPYKPSGLTDTIRAALDDTTG